MNTKILVLFALTFILIFVPLVSATVPPTFTLDCPATAEPGGAVQCTLKFTGMEENRFGGLDFVVDFGSFTLSGNPATTYGSLMYNPTNKRGALAYGFAGIPASGTLVTFNFQAGATTGANTVGLTGVVYYDENSATSQVAALSDSVQVGSTCTARAATACTAGIGCPGNTPILATGCPSGQSCDASNQCVTTCTARAATACTAGVSCPGNTLITATGCPSGQSCDASGACVQTTQTIGQQIGAQIDTIARSEPGVLDAQGQPVRREGWTTSFISRLAALFKSLWG